METPCIGRGFLVYCRCCERKEGEEKMKAKELIKILNEMIAKNGNLDILVPDAESAFFANVKGVNVVKTDKFNPQSGFELEIERNF